MYLLAASRQPCLVQIVIGRLQQAARACNPLLCGTGRPPNGQFGSMAQFGSTASLGHKSASPVMSKLESIASSAVRAADKVHASLIIVYTHTGQTANPSALGFLSCLCHLPFA